MNALLKNANGATLFYDKTVLVKFVANYREFKIIFNKVRVLAATYNKLLQLNLHARVSHLMHEHIKYINNNQLKAYARS